MYRFLKKDTNIFGLKYRPVWEGDNSSERGDGSLNFCKPETEVTKIDRALVASYVNLLKNVKCIVEIGICRNEEGSFTYELLKKQKDTVYLGIDIDYKGFLDNEELNIHTLQCDSHDHKKIRDKLASLGISKIDILFIDGYHSVNSMINDWAYSDILSEDGVVLIHDTCAHPGPVLVWDAIDEELFEKKRYFDLKPSHGIGVVRFKGREMIDDVF